MQPFRAAPHSNLMLNHGGQVTENDFVHKELERRFVVNDQSIVDGAPSEYIVQAYVFSIEGFAIRVRYSKDESEVNSKGKATLTGKGPRIGDEREEYEIEVSELWARQVISRAANVMRKRRYQVVTDQTWEVDEFLDENEGLWIAELEGGAEVRQIKRPDWARREIVNEPMLDNESLTMHPLSKWSAAERAEVGV
jgi:adenylate cyclase